VFKYEPKNSAESFQSLLHFATKEFSAASTPSQNQITFIGRSPDPISLFNIIIIIIIIALLHLCNIITYNITLVTCTLAKFSH
jgi:hypothetical protein